MKNKDLLTALFSILVFTNLSSQVIIGDKVGTASNKTSVLLEFANTNNKGVILPYVTALPASPTPGTLVLDATNPSQARVKFYNLNTAAGSDGWTDLSGQNGVVTSEINYQNSYQTNEANSKAIIGASTSTVDGVLVLESTTKAMVLPIVSDVNNIPSPSPGMMVYINKSGAKRLAVFNGSKWSFWKP